MGLEDFFNNLGSSIRGLAKSFFFNIRFDQKFWLVVGLVTSGNQCGDQQA